MTSNHLRTERLEIRPFAARDVEAHVDMMMDERAAAFLSPTGKPRSRAEEWRAAACYLGHWHIRGFGFFSVIDPQTDEWLGRVGPWMPEGWPGLECGWSICPDHWGKGYAPEAAVATIKWTFEKFPDLPRIISVIDPSNANSQAVAKKIGEEKTGEVFPFHDFSLDVWAADREDWLKQFA